MKNNYKIGVTGGIGSGKSQAIAYFGQKGFDVFSCDEINAGLLDDKNYIKTLKKHFPNCVVGDKVDKSALAKEIFSCDKKRKLLQFLAHPAILERLFFAIEQSNGVSFSEVPLLFESDLTEKFDKILVLLRPQEKRIESLIERDDTTEEKIKQKFALQFDYEKALAEGKFSDEKFYLIFNDGDLKDLKNKLDDFLRTLS